MRFRINTQKCINSVAFLIELSESAIVNFLIKELILSMN